jgi:hypothetical protein
MPRRPPIGRIVLYALGFRVPGRYDEWVFADLTGRGWRVRESLRVLLIALPFVVGSLFLPGPLGMRLIIASFFVFGPALVTAAYADEFRVYRLRQHGFLPPSGPGTG